MIRNADAHFAAIGMGSNLGDRAANLLRAVRHLIAAGINVFRLSSIYQTDPVDYLDQPRFLNIAAIVTGSLPDPEDLLEICLKIEFDLGRDRIIPKGPRLIDLDLLIYDDLILDRRSDCRSDRGSDQRLGRDLILPHPRMHDRRFVLEPLAEILPLGVHPKLGVSYKTLLEALPFQGEVALYRE